MITDNEYIDMAHTVMGMHHFEDGSKNQIKAMLHFAELYHEEQVKKLHLHSVSKCEDYERRDLLLAFKDYLNKNRVTKYTEAVVDNFLSQQ